MVRMLGRFNFLCTRQAANQVPWLVQEGRKTIRANPPRLILKVKLQQGDIRLISLTIHTRINIIRFFHHNLRERAENSS